MFQLKTDEKTSSNITAVIQADTGKPARHIEMIQGQGNDIKPMSDWMYHGDVSEAKLGFKQMVQNFEEISFKEKKDGATKWVNGNYWVPLPFKNPYTCFPDNKGQVMRRIKDSERKFARTSSFFEQYETLVEYMSNRFFANESSKHLKMTSPVISPHHGVDSLAKPDNIRVDFNI